MKKISSFWLKLTAMITMIFDHTTIRYFNNVRWMRFFGRCSMPLYAFLIAESVHHTEEKGTVVPHAIRLFLLALISEIPYDLYFSNTLWNPDRNSVMGTLLTGYLACILIHRTDHPLLKLLITGIACWIPEHFHFSYRFAGVLLIIAFEQWITFRRKHPERSSFWMPALILLVFAGYYVCHGVKPFNAASVWHTFRTYQWSQHGVFLSLPLLLLYNGRQGCTYPAWISFYRLFYPLHLSVLLMLEKLFQA